MIKMNGTAKFICHYDTDTYQVVACMGNEPSEEDVQDLETPDRDQLSALEASGQRRAMASEPDVAPWTFYLKQMASQTS